MDVQNWGRMGIWGLVVVWSATPATAGTRFPARDLSSLQTKGADVGKAFLVECYNKLPHAGRGAGSPRAVARMKAALATFQDQVKARYTEGTLQRLLDSPAVEARRAAVLALGMIGTLESNSGLAAMLHDEDRRVRELASDALWALWFRADTDANGQELRRLLQETDARKAIAGLDSLIARAPAFAEAYNQRAILYFRLEEYQRSIEDCQTVLQLNPHHFGAQAGLAQCCMKLKKARAALKAFRKAHELNPNLEGVEETIHFLENALGEEGKKDDRK
jgi:tetratricopeptide (TPR) repeat protein